MPKLKYYERNSHRFGATWRWLNNDIILILWQSSFDCHNLPKKEKIDSFHLLMWSKNSYCILLFGSDRFQWDYVTQLYGEILYGQMKLKSIHQFSTRLSPLYCLTVSSVFPKTTVTSHICCLNRVLFNKPFNDIKKFIWQIKWCRMESVRHRMNYVLACLFCLRVWFIY